MPLVEHDVPADADSDRLDRYLLRVMPAIASVSQARKLARRGAVLVDGVAVRGTNRLIPGSHISLTLPDGPAGPVLDIRVPVIYEDDWLAVVDKPPGIEVSGNRRRTLVHALPGQIRPSTQPDALPWPHPVHRLDSRTGGLVIVAKTAHANVALGRAFQERHVEKRYRALLVGRLLGQGRVDTPIDDRAAATRYRAISHSPSFVAEWLTTVDLWPETGRTHQLRRHMAELGHPVFGEDLYRGTLPNVRHKGLYLRAVSLRLAHPITGEPLHVEIPEPDRFEHRRQRESRRHTVSVGEATPGEATPGDDISGQG